MRIYAQSYKAVHDIIYSFACRPAYRGQRQLFLCFRLYWRSTCSGLFCNRCACARLGNRVSCCLGIGNVYGHRRSGPMHLCVQSCPARCRYFQQLERWRHFTCGRNFWRHISSTAWRDHRQVVNHDQFPCRGYKYSVQLHGHQFRYSAAYRTGRCHRQQNSRYLSANGSPYRHHAADQWFGRGGIADVHQQLYDNCR